ncbi:MAG: ABC transporter permease [Defluviitaleaceae bacterium]|nr:ABC transporter permease [Defluviitaleaceae bacterium]MCL2239215.1 ABC transporter permease [Defluviitaleaceae bacterium]
MNKKTSLSTRIFRANAKRNGLIFVAILLTTFMIASSLSVAMSFLATLALQNVQRNATAAHVHVMHVSERAVTQLQGMESVASVGLARRAADVVFFADEFTMIYYDAEYWQYHKLPALLDVQGRLPQAVNEIMLSRRFLFQLAISEPMVGMDVTINFWTANGQEHQAVFVLSGYYTSLGAASWHEPLGVPVSAAFLYALGDNAISSTRASVIFHNDRNLPQSISQMQNALYRPFSLHTNSDFNAGSPAALMAIIAVLIALLMITGFLLIYNILHISVANDIRLYGLLKAVGTTPIQIYGIVIVQAVILCIVAVPLGVGLAAVASLAFVPMVLQILGVQMTLVVSLSPIIFVGAALLAVLTTFLGSLSCAKKAARISPIEATRYTEQELNKKRVLFPTRGRPFLMAMRNIFFRNKKRMATVFISLFFSSVLFMTVAVISFSMDAEQYLDGIFEENNFSLRHWPRDARHVVIGRHDSPITFNEPVRHIDEAYLHRLASLPGFISLRYVTRAGGFLTYTDAFLPYARGVHDFVFRSTIVEADGTTRLMTDAEHAEQVARITSPEWLRPNFHTTVYGVCVDEVYAVRHIFDPPIDIDAFARGEAALFSSNRNPHLLEGIGNIELTLSGGTFDFEMAGVTSRMFGDIRAFGFFGAPAIIVARPFLEEHAMTFIYQVDIRVYEAYEPLALMELEALTEHDAEILFGARLIERVGVQSMQLLFWAIGGSVAGVIGLTGLLNFINVMSVGIMSRKKELAAMESIGMTKEQVRDMLMFEGAGYGLVVLATAAVLGNLIAIGLFNFVYNADGTGIFNFQYPFVLFVIMAMMIVAICLYTPLIAYRKVNNATIVERLREM